MIMLTNEDINDIKEIFQKYSPWIGNKFTEEEIWVATVVDFLKTSGRAKPLLLLLLQQENQEPQQHP